MGAFLGAADVFVSDSFFEGWSVSASEAAWAGLPLVLSECGGARELVGDDDRGRLVPNPAGDPLCVDLESLRCPPEGSARRNEAALAAALGEILEERDAWRARAPDLRAHARRSLSPQEMARAYAAVLRRLAEGRS